MVNTGIDSGLDTKHYMQILPRCIFIWYGTYQANRSQDKHVQYNNKVDKVNTIIYISIYSHLTIYNQNKVNTVRKKNVYL